MRRARRACANGLWDTNTSPMGRRPSAPGLAAARLMLAARLDTGQQALRMPINAAQQQVSLQGRPEMPFYQCSVHASPDVQAIF